MSKGDKNSLEKDKISKRSEYDYRNLYVKSQVHKNGIR